MRSPALPIVLRALPAANDAAWCGHQGQASTVPLVNGKGELAGRRVFERGELSSEKQWYLTGQPRDSSKFVNEGGRRLRRERHHDDRGRVTRERELDEAGQVTRDDAVFEDGLREAFSR